MSELFSPISGRSVVARVPLRPACVAISAYDCASIRAAVQSAFANEAARAALYVASPSLFAALIPSLDSGEDIPERVLLKAFRYVVRMATRCTPFGLFASVAPVTIGDETTLSLHGGSRRAYSRLDMSLAERIVTELEFDRGTRGDLRVYASDYVSDRGTACITYRNPHWDTESSALQCQVLESTPLLKSLREFAREGAAISSVCAWLGVRLGVDAEAADGAIDTLLRAGVFVSDLRSKLACGFDSAELLERYAQTLTAERAQLVRELAARLGTMSGANADSLRASGYAEWQRLGEVAFGTRAAFLQTDSVAGTCGSIGREIVDDAATMAELLLHAGAPVSFRTAAARFLARYEGDVLVPLMDLQESPIVDGLVEDAAQNATHNFTEDGYRRFSDLVLRAILHRTHVQCTKQEFLSFFKPPAEDELPASAEIGFQVAAESLAALADGRYLLVPGAYPGSSAAGKSFGRFLHALPDQLSDLREWHAASSESKIAAEVVFPPSASRLGNVCARPRVLPAEIQIGIRDESDETQRLSLSDLFVGVRNERFFLWSESLKREVIPHQHHALASARLTAGVIRFLSLLSVDGLRGGRTLDLGGLQRLPYVPRIAVDRIVVSPARWRLGEACANDADAFARWRGDYAVPRYVWLTENGDQRLLVDLDSRIGCDQVAQACARSQRRTVLLEEAIGVKTPWLQGEGGAYIAEFVLALQLTRRPTAPSRHRRYFPVSERVQAPGDGWLCFKIYCENRLQDHVLQRIVEPLLASLRSLDAADRWFFVRYSDPQPHIRLRFFVPEPVQREQCVRVVWETLRAALKSPEACLSDVVQSTYHRELERYGGLGGMEVAEKFFTADSEIVLRTLRHCTDPGERLFIAVCQAHQAVDALLNAGLLTSWLREMNAYNRKLGKGEWQRINAYKREYFSAAPARNGAFSSIAGDVERLCIADDGAGRPFRFLNSLLHMHFNRFGLGQEQERQAMAVLWHVCAGIAARSRARENVHAPGTPPQIAYAGR